MTKTKIMLNDNQYTYLYKWDVKEPVAVLQLVHGSKEHINRYKEFIEYLNNQNITVIGIDLRGHGEASIEQKQFGNMGANAFCDLIADVEEVSKIVRKEYKDLPYSIYGHSMGSFVVRAHSIKYGAPQYILSGTNEESSLNTNVGILVGKLTKLFKGKNKSNKLIDNLSYKAFNKPFKDEGHPLAWVTNNKKVQKEFEADKLSGQHFTNESFIGMLKLLSFIRKGSSYKNIKAKRTLLISGTLDPVGKMSKGPKKVVKKMKKQNLNAELILYKNGRHEIHNDEDRLQVYKDVAKFIIGK